jgi:hypothetical protein
MRDLSLSGLDFDIEVTGFEVGEIDLLIEALDDTPAAGSDPADILPEVLAAPPVSKLGGSVAAWASSRSIRQRSQSQDLRRADGRGACRDGLHRPALPHIRIG